MRNPFRTPSGIAITYSLTSQCHVFDTRLQKIWILFHVGVGARSQTGRQMLKYIKYVHKVNNSVVPAMTLWHNNRRSSFVSDQPSVESLLALAKSVLPNPPLPIVLFVMVYFLTCYLAKR